MLLLQDAGRKGMLVVGVENGDGFLDDDGSVVKFFVHEVHGATGNSYAVGESLLLRLQSRERGE